ncbi:hypothetical protein K490DRAFT_54115 [Saccharata proteae CBS 121410]|uniref:Uncharacterized protein n=1 Tax=Saccharata proteae CBS 121410 TaxID=1314787 RepID=A0A9P4HXU2_9PEZI|nr:hypothetical protein K490DRAFT_54115 [Saccharata proteae CBS 121410]
MDATLCRLPPPWEGPCPLSLVPSAIQIASADCEGARRTWSWWRSSGTGQHSSPRSKVQGPRSKVQGPRPKVQPADRPRRLFTETGAHCWLSPPPPEETACKTHTTPQPTPPAQAASSRGHVPRGQAKQAKQVPARTRLQAAQVSGPGGRGSVGRLSAHSAPPLVFAPELIRPSLHFFALSHPRLLASFVLITSSPPATSTVEGQFGRLERCRVLEKTTPDWCPTSMSQGLVDKARRVNDSWSSSIDLPAMDPSAVPQTVARLLTRASC